MRLSSRRSPRPPTAVLALSTLLAIALLGGGETRATVVIPGGTTALSRFLGHVDTDPERTVASVNLWTLRQVRRDLDAGPTSDRARLLAYLRAVEALDRAVGDRAVLRRDDPDGRATLDRLVFWFGYAVESDGFPKLTDGPPLPQTPLRREVAHALGWNVRSMADRFDRGETVDVAVPEDRVPSPLPFERWARITGSAPAPDEALATLVADARLSLVLEGWLRLSPGTRREIDDDLLAAVYREAPVEFHRYAAALELRDGRLVPPGGDGALPAWAELLGETRRDRPRWERLLDARGGAPSPVPGVLELLTGDDAIGVHLWHALWFAPPATREYFLDDGPDGRHRRVGLRRLAENLRRIGGAGVFRAGRSATVSVGDALRMFDSRASVRRLDPRVARVLTRGDIGPDCLPPSRLLEPYGGGAGRNAGERLPMLLLDEGRRAERRHELPFRSAARVLDVLTSEAGGPSPGAAFLARRADRYHPDALRTLRRLRLDEATLRVYLTTVERLDCELPSPERTARVLTFQGGVVLVERAVRHGAIDHPEARTWLARWAGSFPDGDPTTGSTTRREMLAALVIALDDPGPDAPGRGPREAAAIAAIAGRRIPGTFAWDGIDYAADRSAEVARRIERMFRDRGVPVLDAALAGNDDDALRSWLVAAAYAPTLAILDDPVLAQDGLLARHRLEEPAYGGPDSVPLLSAWNGVRLVPAAHDPEGSRLVGSLHDVTAGLVQRHAYAFDPWRPSHTWFDVRPWLTAVLESDWDGIDVATFRLAEATDRLGRAAGAAVERDGAAAAFRGLPELRGAVPANRLPETSAGRARITPSERFVLGVRILEARDGGRPFPGFVPADLARLADAARRDAGPGWRGRLDVIGIPTPQTDASSTARVDGWLPYEVVQDELIPRELRERVVQDLAVRVAAFAGRRDLPGPAARDLFVAVLARAPEEVRVATERDWDAFVRWVEGLDDPFFERRMRACLRAGLHRVRW